MCLPTSSRESLMKPTTCVSMVAERQMCPASATPASSVPTMAARVWRPTSAGTSVKTR